MHLQLFPSPKGYSSGKGNQQEGRIEGIEHADQQIDWREVEERRRKCARAAEDEQDDVEGRSKEGLVHDA
jgi:hypothetical protein